MSKATDKEDASKQTIDQDKERGEVRDGAGLSIEEAELVAACFKPAWDLQDAETNEPVSASSESDTPAPDVGLRHPQKTALPEKELDGGRAVTSEASVAPVAKSAPAGESGHDLPLAGTPAGSGRATPASDTKQGDSQPAQTRAEVDAPAAGPSAPEGVAPKRQSVSEDIAGTPKVITTGDTIPPRRKRPPDARADSQAVAPRAAAEEDGTPDDGVLSLRAIAARNRRIALTVLGAAALVVLIAALRSTLSRKPGADSSQNPAVAATLVEPAQSAVVPPASQVVPVQSSQPSEPPKAAEPPKASEPPKTTEPTAVATTPPPAPAERPPREKTGAAKKTPATPSATPPSKPPTKPGGGIIRQTPF